MSFDAGGLDAGSHGDAGSGEAGALPDDSGVYPDEGVAMDAGAPPPTCDDNQTKALQAALDTSVGSSGNAVAVIKNVACGVRYFASGPQKAARAAVHMVGSVTKTFTGSAVLKLVEDGKLSLDDPASKWLANVPGGDAVHVRHLLQHTSGIADFLNSVSWQLKHAVNGTFTPQELLNDGFSQGSQFTPGSQWSYSNTNFVALGLIVEQVSGTTLKGVVHTRLLAPLGLQTVSLGASEPIVGTLAGSSPEISWGFGCGDVVSTPDDIVTWIEARGSGHVHSAAINAELHNGVDVVAGNPDHTYGLAEEELGPSWTSGGGIIYGHDGLVPNAYHTDAFYFPQSATSVVVILDYVPSDTSTADDAFFSICKTLF
jgi:D-alanyl-D-alanine carboxypeptidase